MENKREELGKELSVNLVSAMRLFRTEATKLFESYIPWNEFTVLRILYRQNKEMVSRIACQLNVSNSHITAVSDKLIQKGLLTRSRCDSDRRVVFLEITEEGKKITEQMEQTKQNYFQEKFSVLTKEEMMTMISLLKKIL